MGRWRAGDFYGPGAGGSTIADVSAPRGVVYLDGPTREGQPGLPVTPSLASDGVRVGQFSFAHATIGLLALIGFVLWMDGA